ncbi:heme-binding protein [Pedobacter gandavensis]|uniref:heme-binding protein n=1 Tax=Pedobacter gandavensis TaxID=2679963 RepID=UPI0024785446|nr:heme-binding protein [Pedobacter gandavensis]WGQ11571.1 heme-binding protein [Pedobacter gandavensis]
MRLDRAIILSFFLPIAAYGQTNNSQHAAALLLKSDQLTLHTALQLTDLARTKAAALNKEVAIAILDSGGQIIMVSRGDGVGFHNTEAARRKAFTAVSTKTTTLTLSRNARSNPDSENLASLPELLLLGGGVPIYHKGKVIGAIGVAGGGSPENDDLIGKSAGILTADIIAK